MKNTKKKILFGALQNCKTKKNAIAKRCNDFCKERKDKKISKLRVRKRELQERKEML